jgi:hypothetical protein
MFNTAHRTPHTAHRTLQNEIRLGEPGEKAGDSTDGGHTTTKDVDEDSLDASPAWQSCGSFLGAWPHTPHLYLPRAGLGFGSATKDALLRLPPMLVLLLCVMSV